MYFSRINKIKTTENIKTTSMTNNLTQKKCKRKKTITNE